MTKPVQVDDAAYGKVEIFAKDNGLSLREAASKLLLTNADLLTANAIAENSNCHWDLFNLNIATGEKDFACPIKRQRPDLRPTDKMPILNAEYCKTCPMMKKVQLMFKFEMRLKDLTGNQRPPVQSSVPAAIKAEMEKDTATPKPARTLPDLKGFGVVDCDDCNEVFRAQTVDDLLDDLMAHKKAKHGKTVISSNEATKIRWAREKLEREVAA